MNDQIAKDFTDLLKCPLNQIYGSGPCNTEASSYAEIVSHYAVDHGIGKIIEPFWQLVHFDTTLLTEDLKKPAKKDEIIAECGKFSEEELLGEIDTTSMKWAKTLKKVGMKQTVIQPAACFLLR